MANIKKIRRISTGIFDHGPAADPVNTKKIFTYTKNKDDFMGRENRRYWIVNLKTGKKKRITEAQYHDTRI